MTISTLKEKSLKLIFFLIIAVCSLILPINIKAQKILFKDCHPENNMDSLKKLIVYNQTPTEADRLKNLIKLDCGFLAKAAIFEKLDEIKTLSDKLNNDTGRSYYYFIKGFLLSFKSFNDVKDNLLLGHFYLDKSDDLELKNFCDGIELLCYLNIERITSKGSFPKAKSIFYNKIELQNNQYNLLNEFQKADYLLFASTAEMEINGMTSLKFKKYLNEIESIKKKYPKIKYATYSLNFFLIAYYQSVYNYDKAIILCKESLANADTSDVLLKSRMYYTLANIYIKTNEKQLAVQYYRDALFYFNSIDKYEYSSLATNHKIYYYQMLISNFFKTKFENSKGNLKTTAILKANFNQSQPNFEAINNFFESQIAKQKNSVLTNQNENLHYQKVRQELLYKSATLERSRTELQKVLAIQQVEKQEKKINGLKVKNQQFAILMATITLFLFLVLYFMFRLRKLNKIISERQRNKDRFFAMFSHDLRSLITNLKDSGMILNYLIQNNRLNEIEDISRKLDLDGTHALLLLNNMLDWGILTGYSYKPTHTKILLTNKVWDIIAIYKSEIDSKGKILNIEIENDLYIYSDEKSIDVIFRNIINNAKSYTPEGGQISIRLEKYQINQIAFIVTNSVKDFELGKIDHIQNILSGEREPIAGHHGMGLGMVLIYEFAKNLDIKLDFSIENDFVTFKAIF